MADLVEMLAADAAQEIVKALAGGTVELVKRVPNLWRRMGGAKEDLIKTELERSAVSLREAGDDLPAVQARQEGAWEGRLRDLLVEQPEVLDELQDILAALKGRHAVGPAVVQNVIARAQGTAQGVIGGDIVNYGKMPCAGGGAGQADDD